MYSWQFSKNFPLPKNGGHFEFWPKMEKHKFASVSLTVRDFVEIFNPQGILSNYNFQKILLSSKMAAILNFRIFDSQGILAN